MICLEVGAAPRAALVVAAISRWLVAATGGGWQADVALKRKPETGRYAAGLGRAGPLGPPRCAGDRVTT